MTCSELDFVPSAAVSTVAGGRVLVLASHPDDEVFGCGGAIMRHVAAGDPIQVVIVTDLVYAPSWREVRPDHLILALAVAVRRCARAMRLVMYEAGVPLYPTVPLDITDPVRGRVAQ